MPKLKFYDLKTKKSFETDKFKVEVNKGRRSAITTAPSGIKARRFVSKDIK